MQQAAIESVLRLLTAANAALYIGASILHMGVKVPLGFVTLGFPAPSQPAAIAEGIIGVVLAAASLALFAGAALGWAWGAYVFALAGTLLGLTILLMLQVGGWDLWIHFVMLAGLGAGFALLFAAWWSR
jgi:hypothetical protein